MEIVPISVVPAVSAGWMAPPLPSRLDLDLDRNRTAGLVGSQANIGGIWEDLAAGRLTVVRQELDTHVVRLLLQLGPTSNVTPSHRANVETLKSVLTGRAQKILALDLDAAPSTISSRVRCALIGMGAAGSVRRAPLALAMVAALHELDLASMGEGYQLTYSPNGTQLEISMPRPELAFRCLLTPAELDVVRAIMAGASHRQVGGQRNRSARTIANQIAAIAGKLRANGRFGFIRLAVTLASGSERPHSRESGVVLGGYNGAGN